jgi:hypothetical protein
MLHRLTDCVLSHSSGDCDTHWQQDRADWSDGDWDDYNYAQLAGSAGCRQGAGNPGMRDPLAELCDNLPGFESGDITAVLRDLPIPIPGPGDVPRMTVEEAIEV